MDLQVVASNSAKTELDCWDAFWQLYPRRVAKKLARQAWLRVPVREHGEILAALIAWRRVWLARGEIQYIPYPATWLNGERWTDELPPSAPAVKPLSLAQATDMTGISQRDDYRKTEIPAAVLAELAKLKRRA